MSRLIKGILLGILSATALANELITIFPMARYDQNISNWIKPTDPDYDKPLISTRYQNKRFAEFYSHYYASDADSLSPWSSSFVNKQLVNANGKNIINMESQILIDFYKHGNDPKKIAYGENYRPYPIKWFQQIADNMSLGDLINLKYNAENRAIAIDNLYVRALPTEDPLFYSYKNAGQGYPFDQLQETAIFTGMPLYIIKQSADEVWSLVITSDVIGWVKTVEIAQVDGNFIYKWQQAAQHGLIAIIKQASLIDEQGLFKGTAYNGNTLPLVKTNLADYSVLIPTQDKDGYANLSQVSIGKSNAIKMPLPLTPHNMAAVIYNQIGKPYGWGSMFFYHDCSAETKALFTPFGIYLPRNSQLQSNAGRKVAILDKLNSKDREQYLIRHGHKLTTLVQTPGHILLYVGNYPNPYLNKHNLIAMSYQNIWGLRDYENTTRAVIGGSVIFPLLDKYSEDKNLTSLYDQRIRPKFRLIYLDEDSESAIPAN